MSLAPEKLLTPEEEGLQHKQATLAGLEAQLADRELELAAFVADLVHFEKRYLQTVARRHALLDELKARIAEARAQGSARAAGEENAGAPTTLEGRLRKLARVQRRLRSSRVLVKITPCIRWNYAARSRRPLTAFRRKNCSRWPITFTF